MDDLISHEVFQILEPAGCGYKSRGLQQVPFGTILDVECVFEVTRLSFPRGSQKSSTGHLSFLVFDMNYKEQFIHFSTTSAGVF